jgi:hypothetical protein
MNTTHIHLIFNHVAIFGAIFSVFLLITGIIRKNETMYTIALMGFVMSALAAVAVFLTGEPAEDSVKHLAGVTKATIENHEESAEFSIWLIGLLGVLSLAGLLFRKKNLMTKNIFMISMVVISFIASGAISYTGYLGGKIRHTEISGNTSVQGADQGGEKGEQGENDKD